ncbi:DUF4834 family protein [Hymenobacter rigui]|uniref:DUF4834 family protein n=1 Tax=Hymenobacter rigui TaxID=334424 RepID=A0A3R9PZ40_9BACT|nr:DUF4834 family protein [Hymenobacter rigui]RSK49374.1 DUF4834 family protein [Hymenobacter rigui]
MKFLLILLVLWLFGRYVVPLLMRFIISHLLKKQARQFGQQFGSSPFANPAQPNGQSRSAATGEVHVDYVPPKEKPRKPAEFKGGEYVDFEEVR